MKGIRNLKVLDAGFSQRNLGFDIEWGPLRNVVSEMAKDPTAWLLLGRFLRFFLASHHSAIVPHSATPQTVVRGSPDRSAYYLLLVSELVGVHFWPVTWKFTERRRTVFAGTRNLISTTDFAAEYDYCSNPDTARLLRSSWSLYRS
jgi:hypothetical protein